MKNQILILVAIILVAVSLNVSAQPTPTPTSKCWTIINQDSAHSLSLEIWLKCTDPVQYLYYATAQYFFDFNTGIIPPGKSAMLIKETTDLIPSSLAPGINLKSVYTVTNPGRLQMSANIYSSGNGYRMNPGDSIMIIKARLRITDGTPFVGIAPNITFRRLPSTLATSVYVDNNGAKALIDVSQYMTLIDPPDVPLPVNLASFTGNIENKRDVSLNWKTESEVNNKGFDIERKISGGTFSKIGYIEGKGNSNTEISYNFTDKKLNAGKYNYRLKQIDNNGNYVYHSLSGEIIIELPKKFDLSQNYPNPFNPTTKIDFELPFDSRVSITLYDMSGREVKTLVNDSRIAGYYTEVLNAGNLSSGTYFYRLIAKSSGQEYTMTKKMMLIK